MLFQPNGKRDLFRGPRGDLVYATGKWVRHLFDGEVNQAGALEQVVQETSRNRRDHEQVLSLYREVFGRIYGVDTTPLPEDAIDANAKPWAQKLHDMAEAMPEWVEAHARVNHDPWLAGIATSKVAKALSEHLPELPPPDDELQSQKRTLEAYAKARGWKRLPPKAQRRMDAIEAQIADARNKKAQVELAMSQGTFSIQEALRTSLVEANKDMADAQLACIALGAGTDPGDPRRSEVRSVLKDQRVMSIIRLAGRMRREVRARRKKAARGADELHSIELGDNIQRLLPSELALMGVPMGAELLHAKLTDRRALQYSVRGATKETMGPIIIAIDESGSMGGARDLWAKAVALGAMMIAREDERSFALIHFDARVTRCDFFPRGTGTVQQMVDAVSHFSGGGTDHSAALRRAREIIKSGNIDGVSWPEGRRADVVLVTDGDAPVESAVEEVVKLEAMGASVLGISISSKIHPLLAERMERVEAVTQKEVSAGTVPGTLLAL